MFCSAGHQQEVKLLVQLILTRQQISRNWSVRLATCLTSYLPCCQLSLNHVPLLPSETSFPFLPCFQPSAADFDQSPCWVCLASAALLGVSGQWLLLSPVPLKGDVEPCSSVGDS